MIDPAHKRTEEEIPDLKGYTMQESRGLLEGLRRNWVLVGLFSVLGLVGAFAVTRAAVPLYSAQASLYFSLSIGDSAGDLNQGSTYTQSQMLSFAELANKPVVLDQVIDDLGLDTTAGQLRGKVSATTTSDTVLLDVTVIDRDPRLAARIANSVADALGNVVQQYSPRNDSDTATILARVVDPADVPSSPSSPNTRLTLIAGLLVGFSAGVLITLLRDRIDTRLRSERDLRLITTAPLLGAIQLDPDSDESDPMFHRDPRSPLAEAYRRVRANLQFVGVDDGNLSLVVTSSSQSDGKTTVVANLALALAEADARTILIDGDLRRPAVATLTGIEGSVGLTTVLSGKARLSDVIQPWGDTQLDILPSGAIPPNPSELLSSGAMTRLIEELRAEYEVILIDTPPVLAVADATILARLTSGAVVVVDREKSRAPQLRKSIEALGQAGVTLLGLVYNRMPRSTASPSYTYEAASPASESGRPTGLRSVDTASGDPARKDQKRVYQVKPAASKSVQKDYDATNASRELNGASGAMNARVPKPKPAARSITAQEPE